MEKNKTMKPLTISKKTFVWLLFCVTFSFNSFAEVPLKYLILLKDKAGSTFSVSNPQQFLSARAIARRLRQGIPVTERDFPVNASYVAGIKQTGAKVFYTSRWFNGVLVEATLAQLASIKKLAYYKGIESEKTLKPENTISVNKNKGTKAMFDTQAENYGLSMTQIQLMGIDKMHTQGFRGEGMQIAVIDDGFVNIDKMTHFKNLFSDKRILGTYDFIDNEKNVYNDGEHGTKVLSTIAAEKDGSVYGSAYKASYWLFRTEDDIYESHLEEVNWLMAAEYADSVGVDVVNSSLGYNLFDDPSQDYTYAQLNGKTTIITRAAKFLARTGVAVVISAGNERAEAWHYITAPADADSILSVAATNRNGIVAAFSSAGPSGDGRIKPDIAAMGDGVVDVPPTDAVTLGSGTSYSSPIMAGFVAGFWQANPTLTAQQVIETIKKAGSLSNNPNNDLGYGIPTFDRAMVAVPKLTAVPQDIELLDFKLYPNPFSDDTPITIEWKSTSIAQTADATFYDFTGKRTWTATLPANIPNRIQPTFLKSGSYIFQLKTDQTVQQIRVLKN